MLNDILFNKFEQGIELFIFLSKNYDLVVRSCERAEAVLDSYEWEN